MGISDLCQGCCGSISLPCAPYCQVCDPGCPQGQIGSFLSPTQQVQSLWQAVSQGPQSWCAMRSLCNRSESLPPWWIDKLSLQTSQLEGIAEKCLLGELFCSPLSQPVFSPSRENVVNYTITCRLLLSMVTMTWLGGKGLIALQRLDFQSEVGSECWCQKNMDGQVPGIAL